ncbi:hypothetical protein PIB30_025876 [Stylosanthes scabra]|uniref:Uncharacterized protein n=1 Tax=Stylosanthes scabra TaxID=79078 RepID=A0ABU6XBV2_9FABA|nr:hypothetical protein [Stylosanthes scabra]
MTPIPQLHYRNEDGVRASRSRRRCGDQSSVSSVRRGIPIVYKWKTIFGLVPSNVGLRGVSLRRVSRSTYLTGNLRFSPLSCFPHAGYPLRDDVERIGGSRISRATRSSSIDSTVSSATSRPKRHGDLPHEDDRSDGPRPRSPCMRATAYLHMFARGASSQGVVRQTDRARSVPELLVRIHGSASHTFRSFISTPEGPAEA